MENRWLISASFATGFAAFVVELPLLASVVGFHSPWRYVPSPWPAALLALFVGFAVAATFRHRAQALWLLPIGLPLLAMNGFLIALSISIARACSQGRCL
jgi:hypothetical protein